jgi:hypothetical protein
MHDDLCSASSAPHSLGIAHVITIGEVETTDFVTGGG